MKVLLVGEGPNERGGALETLVRRLNSTEFVIDVDSANRRGIHTHRGKGQGFFKRAVRWMKEAEKGGYDAIVLLIDQDHETQRTRDIAEAQDCSITQIRRALGVAIVTFDAWMLADEKALTIVLGRTINRQPKTESIADPKSICTKLLEEAGVALRASDMYAQIADVVDLQTLETRCPQGFALFAQRVRQL